MIPGDGGRCESSSSSPTWVMPYFGCDNLLLVARCALGGLLRCCFDIRACAFGVPVALLLRCRPSHPYTFGQSIYTTSSP